MKFKIMIVAVLFFSSSVAMAQVEVMGVDAQVMIDAFYHVGQTSSHSNPLTGGLLRILFNYQIGGFELKCTITNPGVVSRTRCRIGVNQKIQARGISIVKSDGLTVVEFSEAEVVQEISQSLPQNPWKSRSTSPNGVERVNIACQGARGRGDQLCRMTLAE